MNWITTFPGRNRCHHCGKKLGLFGGKEVYARFGLTYRFCKNCYLEYKQIMKEARKKQK